MSLSICQIGDPILAQPATSVLDVHDPAIQKLITTMMVTVKEVHGVGLSAPQVGVSIQAMIIASRPNLRYPHAPDIDPFAVINPQVLQQSDDDEWGWEGCLSIPDQRGLVKRSQSIVVEYTTTKGQQVVAEWTGFVARIFQHEYDHLHGRLFLDQQPSQVLSEQDYLTHILKLT